MKRVFGLVVLVITSCNMTWAAVNTSVFCPSILNITVNWIELIPFLWIDWKRNNFTGLVGYLPAYTGIAAHKCGCPMLYFNYRQMNISSSEEIEIKIRESLRSTVPELYFPVFANRKESTQYQRPFLALFQSPGPAVIQLNLGSWEENISSLNMILQTWPILSVFLLLGILAGFIVWAIVSNTIHS
jgi:nitrate reductase NapE component